ncbi:MAG TPA: hypothetical protein VFH43_09740 [Candidatus Kapabacteria bacterium]|nr:hypothetical protein [Candidatus Kapabacteria bacterium]
MLCASASIAQHTPREIGFSFAIGGQGKLEKKSIENRGFFQDAFIWNLRYQITTTGIQNLSFFAEGVSETREYDAQEDINGEALTAHHVVSVAQTTLGLETMRTIVSSGGFRVGIGLGLGFGYGSPSRELTILTTGEKRNEDAASPWLSLLLTAGVRARYTLYRNDDLDIGITASGRYWGFPAIGPSGDHGRKYNGPDFRTLHHVGYLAGVSVGF